jgi:hypothetical protein
MMRDYNACLALWSTMLETFPSKWCPTVRILKQERQLMLRQLVRHVGGLLLWMQRDVTVFSDAKVRELNQAMALYQVDPALMTAVDNIKQGN